MKLSDRMEELIRACFTGIWVESYEHDDVLREISQLCHQQQWRLATCRLTKVWRLRAVQWKTNAKRRIHLLPLER